MRITLLSKEPIKDGFTEAQASLYNFLLERTQAGDPPSMLEMMEAMEVRSHLPIVSRLEHLQLRG